MRLHRRVRGGGVRACGSWRLTDLSDTTGKGPLPQIRRRYVVTRANGFPACPQVAGTEVGVTEPEATFSACFGSAFLMLHPYK